MWWHNEEHTWGSRGSRQYTNWSSLLSPKTSWGCNECRRRRRYECLLTVKRDFCEFWMPPKLNSMNGAHDSIEGTDVIIVIITYNIIRAEMCIKSLWCCWTWQLHPLELTTWYPSGEHPAGSWMMAQWLTRSLTKRGWRRPIDHASILVECTAVPVGRRLFCVWRDERVYSPWLTEEYEKHTLYMCACVWGREKDGNCRLGYRSMLCTWWSLYTQLAAAVISLRPTIKCSPDRGSWYFSSSLNFYLKTRYFVTLGRACAYIFLPNVCNSSGDLLDFTLPSSVLPFFRREKPNLYFFCDMREK